MKRKDLLRAVVGTSKPIHVTKREYVIFDRCLKIINNLENEVKELNLDFVRPSLPTDDEIDKLIEAELKTSSELPKYGKFEQMQMTAAMKAGAKWFKHEYSIGNEA